MELRDPIHGAITLTKQEEAILAHPAVQRLRNIKQMGFAEYSFPGGTHNRFLHSIGVAHLAGKVFDRIFYKFPFQKTDTKNRLRQTLKLAAMLHDLGHGPLSHITETIMPPLKDLNIKCYKDLFYDDNQTAQHEDYTIKIITDSDLKDIILKSFPDIAPINIACLLNKEIEPETDFFVNQGIHLRKILSQIINSDLDVDKMDYLQRDSHFCGVNYGRVEVEWITSNLTYHQEEEHLYLALNHRALYSFDNFFISRHHMYLTVYFHHNSWAYEEMLLRYVRSDQCTFQLPSDINEYLKYDDYLLQQHLKESKNYWAKLIAQRNPYRMLYEVYTTDDKIEEPKAIQSRLEQKGIQCFHSSSSDRVSKYQLSSSRQQADKNNWTDKILKNEHPIFVLNTRNPLSYAILLDEATKIFHHYQDVRHIKRLYVQPDKFVEAQSYLTKIKKL